MRPVTRPRIVGETKRPVLELRPPSATRPHEWLSEDAERRYNEICTTGRVFDIYFSSVAENKIREQAAGAAPMRHEVMGLLLGEVRIWKSEIYTVVRGVSTTDLRSSSANVKFDPEALPRLFIDLDSARFDYVVVGWYHSHPGHTCFMSRTDLNTQRSIFTQPYHFALVIDPINMEIEAFKTRGNGYVSVPFAIVDGATLRTRRLKAADSPAERQIDATT